MRLRHMVLLMACALLTVMLCAPALAENKYPGWEEGSEYDKLYNVADLEEFKVDVLEIIDITPMPGMAPGVGFKAKEPDGDEEIIVHLGPKDFVDLKRINLRPGDRIKIRGVEVELAGDWVFMASKVKKGEDGLKLRLTKNGKPLWVMSPEELAKEMEDQ